MTDWAWFILGISNGGLILGGMYLLRVMRDVRIKAEAHEHDVSRAIESFRDKLGEFRFSKADNDQIGELRREMQSLAGTLGVKWTVFGQGWKKEKP